MQLKVSKSKLQCALKARLSQLKTDEAKAAKEQEPRYKTYKLAVLRHLGTAITMVEKCDSAEKIERVVNYHGMLHDDMPDAPTSYKHDTDEQNKIETILRKLELIDGDELVLRETDEYLRYV